MWTSHTRLMQALNKHSVTPCEYQAMICPYYEEPLEPEEMAAWTVKENQAGSRRDTGVLFSEKEYLLAIRQMIAKGWLMIQSRDVKRVVSQRKADNIPQREQECVSKKGTVEFTRKGYLLHRRILKDGYGNRCVQEVDSFVTTDQGRHEVHFYAGSILVCHEWIQACRQAYRRDDTISDLVGGPTKVIAIRGPYRIGRWRPSRFLTLQHGYHVVVKYQKLRRRRLDMPVVNLTGWIERLNPVSAYGHIHTNPFVFGDHASWMGPSIDDRFAVFTWQFIVKTKEDGKERYEIKESSLDKRRTPLTLAQARQVLEQCARLYLARDH